MLFAVEDRAWPLSSAVQLSMGTPSVRSCWLEDVAGVREYGDDSGQGRHTANVQRLPHAKDDLPSLVSLLADPMG